MRIEFTTHTLANGLRVLVHEDQPWPRSIQVGGWFLFSNGVNTQASSLGCFTLCGNPENGNKEMKIFVKYITDRQQANREAGKGDTVNVTIEKRQDVDWEFVVDEDGKKL